MDPIEVDIRREVGDLADMILMEEGVGGKETDLSTILREKKLEKLRQVGETGGVVF